MSTTSLPDEETYCIFQQPWWLEAVAPGKWDIIEIEKGGSVFARLPYVKEKKMGADLITMPPFTQVLGPWIKPLPGKYASRLSKEKELLTDLIEQLPDFDYFKQRFHFNLTNWLPFYWKDFEQTTRYTYTLDDISDPEKVWDNMDGSTRREIKKARKQVTVKQTDDPEIMWEFHLLNFEDKKAPEGNLELFKNLHEACKQHDAGQILYAEDENRNIHSCLFLVWDENAAYYLMGGTNPELRTSGAFSLLMFEAVKFASDKTKRFDFEGSMIESIERFYRGFGGRQKPYFHITKKSKKMELLMTGKNTFQKLLS